MAFLNKQSMEFIPMKYNLQFSFWIRILLVINLVIASSILLGGTTGKIKGTVLDAKTGNPLPGVNIIVEETILGAATDLEGQFIILNVPPGTYTLRATYIGYGILRVENVKVSVDLTTTTDFELSEEVLQTGEVVTVVAEKEMVVKDLTATTAVVDAQQIQAMPVTEIGEAIELQAGLVKDAGGGIHVRGGRTGEMSYWIDGVPVTDVYDGGTVVDVNKDMVQELQVISGAFNAEYGQAMSGIVNITTKEGNNEFGGSLSSYAGDYLSSHTDVFRHIDDVNPLDIRNIEGTLHGPIIKDKLFFSINARSIYFDGWQHGTNLYNPGAYTMEFIVPQDFINDVMPEYRDSGLDLGDGTRAFSYIAGSNAVVDSFLVYSNMPEAYADIPDSFAVYYDKYSKAHADGKGDGKKVSMNWNRKYYTQAKLFYRITPSMKLSYNFIYDNVKYQDFDRNYILNPNGNLNRFRVGQTHILKLTHTLSPTTFYDFGISFFSKNYKQYVYEDAYDPYYVHPDLALQDPYSYQTAGTNNNRLFRETNTYLAKFDITSQVTKTHQMKFGLEARQHDLYYRNVNLRPVDDQLRKDFLFDGPYIDTQIMPDSTIHSSQYQHSPLELSAYIQDKMEFEELIVNVGIRVDYFEPDGVVLTDGSDPNIYNPIKPENRFRDYGSDGIEGTFDPDGTEGNSIQDPGEANVTLGEREAYWYKKADPKIQFGPRLGVSFPISERGVIHFSYGHFFQIPRFERLYQNPDFDLGSGTGNVGVVGNADLKPEKTVSGEIGLQQQLTDDISIHVTGYFRDIRDLAGTRSEEIEIFGGSARYSKFTNSDFGFARGFIVDLNKHFSNRFSASVNYMFQIAKGSNSDPEAARNALAGGQDPEVQLTPLAWDQMQTVNASFSYGHDTWGFSLLGQWGSGLPYTPRRSTDITTLLTNSQLKPVTYNVDLKAYKDFKVGIGVVSCFLRVMNLLDTKNEVNVFDDTGRAGFTTDLAVARASNPALFVNSLEDWFLRPTHWAEPRRVEFGVTYRF